MKDEPPDVLHLALQRLHQEQPSESRLGGDAGGPHECADQLVQLVGRQHHVRVAEQSHQVVSLGPQQRVLEVDHAQFRSRARMRHRPPSSSDSGNRGAPGRRAGSPAHRRASRRQPSSSLRSASLNFAPRSASRYHSRKWSSSQRSSVRSNRRAKAMQSDGWLRRPNAWISDDVLDGRPVEPVALGAAAVFHHAIRTFGRPGLPARPDRAPCPALYTRGTGMPPAARYRCTFRNGSSGGSAAGGRLLGLQRLVRQLHDDDACRGEPSRIRTRW